MATSINEDICSLKLQVQSHEGHLARVANVVALTDVSLPKSYGLKHLETRGKKKQLLLDKKLSIDKSDEILARDLKHIAAEERKQPRPIRLESSNEKMRLNELVALQKNNRHMAFQLEHITSAMPSKKELQAHSARNLKQKKLLSRKFFGAIPNPNTGGQKHSRITQADIDAKPEWVGVRPTGGGALDALDSGDFTLNGEEDDHGGERDRQLKRLARRRRPETPKAKPTNNHLKPKMEKIQFKIVNMPKSL